jgi:hypothetical protein
MPQPDGIFPGRSFVFRGRGQYYPLPKAKTGKSTHKHTVGQARRRRRQRAPPALRGKLWPHEPQSGISPAGRAEKRLAATSFVGRVY